jgi:hypothetical protein
MYFLNRNRHGQILVMATLALFAMCGIMGLAVDLGWSYFVKKQAQAAADAAALAAATQAYASVGFNSSYTKDTDAINMAWAPSPIPCPDTNTGTTNLDKGCLYAERNGFKVGGRQNVLIQADFGPPIPTAPGVNAAQYWVTVRVSETIPQLFSSILGNTSGLVSARATAALVKSEIVGSFHLLNRQNDCVPMGGGQPVCGVDLIVQAEGTYDDPALLADGGILMASLANDPGPQGPSAGENQGGGVIKAPFTWIRRAGSENGWYFNQGNSADWITTPINRAESGDMFRDPLRNRYGNPAPPVGDSSLDRPVMGGTFQLSSDPNAPTEIGPGYYYAAAVDPTTGNTIATGEPLRMSGYVHFKSGGDFGEFVFFGGITVGQQGAGETKLTFDAGRYVFSGVRERNGGKPGVLFDITTNLEMTDGQVPFQAAPESHGGEIFIFTGFDRNAEPYSGRYPVGQDGGDIDLYVPQPVWNIRDQLDFGISGFQSGNNALNVNLHGLNMKSPKVPQELRDFEAPLLIWQDQRNSVIDYYQGGSFNMGCVIGENVGGDCNNTLSNNGSPQLFFKASPGSSLWGVIYQPRGAWTTVWGGSGYAGPLQIVTGAFHLQANANLWLQGIDQPIMGNKVALVE